MVDKRGQGCSHPPSRYERIVLPDQEFLGNTLIRADLNSPIQNKEVQDNFRIAKAIENLEEIRLNSKSVTYTFQISMKINFPVLKQYFDYTSYTPIVITPIVTKL